MEEEQAVIELDGWSIDVAREKGDRSLIGRVCMERVIEREVITTTMAQIWRISILVSF